jgi:hypothetical protein
MANDSPCRVRSGLAPPSRCALPGAHKKGERIVYAFPDFRYIRFIYLLIPTVPVYFFLTEPAVMLTSVR